MSRQEIANQLALDWANRHITGIRWLEILDTYHATQRPKFVDTDHIVSKLLDLHERKDCHCPNDCGHEGYCRECGLYWPCKTSKILDGKA